MLIIHNILITVIKIENNCCVQNVVIKAMRLNFVGLIYYVCIVIKKVIQKDGALKNYVTIVVREKNCLMIDLIGIPLSLMILLGVKGMM